MARLFASPFAKGGCLEEEMKDAELQAYIIRAQNLPTLPPQERYAFVLSASSLGVCVLVIVGGRMMLPAQDMYALLRRTDFFRAFVWIFASGCKRLPALERHLFVLDIDSIDGQSALYRRHHVSQLRFVIS